MRVPSRPRTPDPNTSHTIPHAPPPFTLTPDRSEPLTLDGSWIPIGSVGDTENITASVFDSETDLQEDYVDDDDSSLDLSSSVDLGSIDGSTNGSRSPYDDHETRDGSDTPESLASSRIMGDYVDAEAPSTRLEDSVPQIQLVYPDPLEDSFASSLTVSDTTPTASVGSLQPSSDMGVGVGRRSSKYRLDAKAGIPVITEHEGEHSPVPVVDGVMWCPTVQLADSGFQANSTSSSIKLHSSSVPLSSSAAVKADATLKKDEEEALASDRLLRAAKGIRQKWCVTPPSSLPCTH